MSTIKKPAGRMVRRADRKLPILEEPKLGHVQCIVLKRLQELGSQAYGYNVLEGLCLDFGVWLDAAQIYGAIRRMAQDDYITLVETRKQAGAPPLKIYALTNTGRAALAAAAAHHRAMADFLNDIDNSDTKPSRVKERTSQRPK